MNTVSEVVARVVGEHVTEVFTLMGNGNAYFTDALARQGNVRMIGLRHEAGTVASADAYYRVSRKIAVATTTFGPGYTNTITPLAEAVLSQTPMVFVVGDQPTTGPRPWDVDQTAIAHSVGAQTLTVSVENAAQVTTDAFALAQAQRIPVLLFIPHDIAAAPAQEETVAAPEAPVVPSPDETLLAQAPAADRGRAASDPCGSWGAGRR